MKTLRKLATTCGVSLSLVLGGCAGTPKEEMDQANQTAMLITSFTFEVQNFKNTQAKLASERVDSVKRLTTQMEVYKSGDKFDDRTATLAGQESRGKLVKELTALADARAQDSADLANALTDLDTKYATVVSPLPDIGPQLEASRKQLAVLGSDLSVKDRISLIASFAKEVKEAVDKNKDQFANASAASAAEARTGP